MKEGGREGRGRKGGREGGREGGERERERGRLILRCLLLYMRFSPSQLSYLGRARLECEFL